jgi:hypothetical protein
MKNGWKTSEFWVSVGSLVGIATSFAGQLQSDSAKVAVGIVAAAYSLARSIAKALGAKA